MSFTDDEPEKGGIPIVSDVTATPTTNSITVSWKPPEGDITGYKVFCALVSKAEGFVAEVMLMYILTLFPVFVPQPFHDVYL